MLDQYQREEVRVFKLYVAVRQKYMSSKVFRDLELQQQSDRPSDPSKLREQWVLLAVPPPNVVLLSLYIDHVLYETFGKVESLVRQQFLTETNVAVKMLALDKIHDYYKECQGSLAQKTKIETVLLAAFEAVFVHKKPSTSSEDPYSNTSNQNLKI